MTIPTLVANYNAKQWSTAATVFERKLEDSLKTMNTQSTLAGHTTTESFVEELSKHFKTNKICSNDKLLDCFSDIVYWGGGDATPEEVDMSKIKVAKDFGQDDWNTNIVGVQFANGVSALIAYNPTTGDKACTQDPYSNRITGGDCLAILYDTSGAKNPNTSGKDLRANGNVTRLGASTCAFELNGTCFGMPFFAEPINNEECESIKSSHGINECEYNEDYWAGAVKACGGVSKMANSSQLADIANFIYDTTDIGAETIKEEGISMNTNKASSLGFSIDESNSFYVWAAEEDSANVAYLRGFYSTSSYWSSDNRRDGGYQQTVCIE